MVVLKWLEESYGSKEPVDPTHLTIEHVVPQTPTPAWRDMLGEDLHDGETVEEAHESVVHTLGNLTLSEYNTPLSNQPFAEKRAKLATSGLEMNQEIATQDRWSRPQILARADALTKRARAIWPGPMTTTGQSEGETLWALMNQALAAMPAGTWTTCGDLAALIGTHPVPLGQRLASHPAPNAHRVLQGDGSIASGFRWPDPARTDDPRDVLRDEGVLFYQHGHADQSQRLTVEELARLAGLADDEPREAIPDPEAAQNPERRDRFLDQLAAAQSPETTHGVIAFLDIWTGLDGHLAYGRGSETSCFILPAVPSEASSRPWPFTIYPSGKCEIVFQHMLPRPPFDDAILRDQFRTQLNAISGVNIPAGKLEMRPCFPLAVLASERAVIDVLRAVCWFTDQIWQHYEQPATWTEEFEAALRQTT